MERKIKNYLTNIPCNDKLIVLANRINLQLFMIDTTRGYAMVNEANVKHSHQKDIN